MAAALSQDTPFSDDSVAVLAERETERQQLKRKQLAADQAEEERLHALWDATKEVRKWLNPYSEALISARMGWGAKSLTGMRLSPSIAKKTLLVFAKAAKNAGREPIRGNNRKRLREWIIARANQEGHDVDLVSDSLTKAFWITDAAFDGNQTSLTKLVSLYYTKSPDNAATWRYLDLYMISRIVDPSRLAFVFDAPQERANSDVVDADESRSPVRRRNLWFYELEKTGLTFSKIRDKWNRMAERDRERICPQKSGPIGSGRRGYDTVRNGIKAVINAAPDR
jgi:hypothetical protein